MTGLKKGTIMLRVLGVLAVGAIVSFAQGGDGTITGSVIDVDGDVVYVGSLEAKNTATGAVFKTDISDGTYSLTQLPPGTYDVSIDIARFVPYLQQGVSVRAGQASRLDITMKWAGLGPALGDNITDVSNDMRARPVPTGPTPRMPDGKPDFSGVWLTIPETNRSPAPLPLQRWADAIRKERNANFSKDMPQALCQPSGPMQIASPFPHKIVQAPTLLVQLEEFDVAMVRQVFLDGRSHPDPKTGKMGSRTWNPSWLGHSIGRWEGETLVIDTVGFNDRSWLMFLAPGDNTSPHTEQLHLVERLRRPDFGHLEADITAEDPGAFTAPYYRHVTATIGAPGEELQEFICNEDNIDIPHLVGK